jgi:DNA end-binding protein Ku
VKAGMAARPTWQGHLKLSLVSCAVALYSAVDRRGEIHFHLLHNKTHNRVRMVPTDPDLGPVERTDLVKGYEFEKDRYIVLTDQEIDAVRLESTHAIDIDRFVDREAIDRLYWNDPYYLAPADKAAVEAFCVIREAMSRAGKIALGRLVLHQRERRVALEPDGKGMIVWSLRSHDEIRDAGEYFDGIPGSKPPAAMVDIATRIIEQQEGPFDPSEFVDRYENALRELIRARQKGTKSIVQAAAPDDSNVIDLMDALRRSLGGSRPRVAKTASDARPAPRKSPSRKSSARKSSARKRA